MNAYSSGNFKTNSGVLSPSLLSPGCEAGVTTTAGTSRRSGFSLERVTWLRVLKLAHVSQAHRVLSTLTMSRKDKLARRTTFPLSAGRP